MQLRGGVVAELATVLLLLVVFGLFALAVIHEWDKLHE